MTNTFFLFSLWLCQAFFALWVAYFICDCVCFCVCVLGPDVFLISVDERAKHDQQFHSLSPTAGGYITGNTLYLSLCLIKVRSGHCYMRACCPCVCKRVNVLGTLCVC